MFRIFRALLRASIELRRIREILEIVYKQEIELHNLYAEYSKKPISKKISDIVVDSRISPELDDFGEPIDEEEQTAKESTD